MCNFRLPAWWDQINGNQLVLWRRRVPKYVGTIGMGTEADGWAT